MGAMYFYGLHKARDYEKAMELMQRSVEKGCTLGSYFIAIMCAYELCEWSNAKLTAMERKEPPLTGIIREIPMNRMERLGVRALDGSEDGDASREAGIILYDKLLAIRRREWVESNSKPLLERGCTLEEVKSIALVAIRRLDDRALDAVLKRLRRSVTAGNRAGRIMDLIMSFSHGKQCTWLGENQISTPMNCTRWALLLEVVRLFDGLALQPSRSVKILK